MTPWRDLLIEPFVAGISRLWAVCDPDDLLLDGEVTRMLSERGFVVVTYADPVEFRLRYETQWRTDTSEIEWIVRAKAELDALPFDVLAGSRRLPISRRALFPGLPRRALEWMGAEHLDWLATRPSREQVDRLDRRARALAGLLTDLERSLPEGDVDHGQWSRFAMRWASTQALRMEDPEVPRPHDAPAEVLHDRIEAAFNDWVVRRYGALQNLPPTPPVMLHHVTRAMARLLENGVATRVALVLLDGMSFDQWRTLRATMDLAALRCIEREEAVYAWVPTTTVVSRQALFAGEPPSRFAGKLGGTSGEPGLWTAFWEKQCVSSAAVGYVRGLGDGPSADFEGLVNSPRIRALGVVVDKIDRIMHGMELGAAGMHNQVRQWGQTGWLSSALKRLLDAGFTVVLTSDHGNLEVVGTGRLPDRALADVRGERVRVFDDDALRQKVAREVPSAHSWAGPGLPQEYLALLAMGRTAFAERGKRLVGHGGIAIEEVIVPLVTLSR